MERLHRDHGIHIRQESQGRQEFVGHPSPELLEQVWSLATSQIEAAGDHLAAIASLLAPDDGRYSTYAPLSCVRAMLEPCANAAWLLDPNIDAHERAKRVFAARFEAIDQERKYAIAAGQPSHQQTHRIGEIARYAEEIGLRTFTHKTTGRTIGIGMMMPRPTELIKTQLDHESWYRFLSAVSHGKLWALRIASMRPATVVPGHSATGESTLFEKFVYVDLLVTVACIATTSLARAVWAKFNYGGWDLEPLQFGLNGVFDTLKIPSQDRFWESTTANNGAS